MEVLLRPLITEKQSEQTDKLSTYGFVVDRRANKLQVKKEIEDLYGVNVVAVRTHIMPGKTKTRYTKAGLLSGRKGSYKKAIITLAEGDSIDFYDEI
ncbi:MAG: 50S ribosomal protein L23 [Chitinophagales bacterium]|nr:50S ribosomal protein L23 [Chitinophagales bacterium]